MELIAYGTHRGQIVEAPDGQRRTFVWGAFLICKMAACAKRFLSSSVVTCGIENSPKDFVEFSR